MGEFAILFIGAFFLLIIMAIVVGISKGQSIRDENIAAAQTIEAKLREQNFIIEKEIGNDLTKIYVDNTHKQWAIKEKGINTDVRIYKYSDLIDFELLEDRNSVIKGSAGRALIGGALGGTKGAVIGGSGSRAVKETVGLLEIKIRINDFEYPQYTIEFIKGYALPKNSTSYRQIMDVAQQIIGVLHYIATNGGEMVVDEHINNTGVNNQTLGEQLRELNQLKEEGIITLEEFELKKKSLLNL